MKQQQRTRKLTVRLTQKEFETIENKFKETTCSQLSQYIRQLIFQKPVTIKVRNTSLDAVIEEIILARQELNAIGNNYNQAVKKLHSLKQIPEFRQWIAANEKHHQQFIQQTNLIQQRMDEITSRWLNS